MKQDVIILTRKQLTDFSMIEKANNGIVTVKEAAEALGLSTRQIKRLKKKVKEGGAAALVHRNSGRPPSNRIDEKTRKEVVRLKKEDIYKGSNFKHYGELLSEHYGIEIGYSTLYGILKESGISSPKTRRRYKPHRRRKRRPQAGMLLQVDATPYAWFKGDKKKYALHGAIDDATSQVTGLYMCKNECMHGYFEMLRRTIAPSAYTQTGIPYSSLPTRRSQKSIPKFQSMTRSSGDA